MTYRDRLKQVVPVGSLHFCEAVVVDQDRRIVFSHTFDPGEGVGGSRAQAFSSVLRRGPW